MLTPSDETSTAIQRDMDDRFRFGTPRPKAYQAGYRYAVTREHGAFAATNPYALGSAGADAWFAGNDNRRAEEVAG